MARTGGAAREIATRKMRDVVQGVLDNVDIPSA
jgi:hypothetical protein